ncbi:MAG TPA: dihydrolipoamide acetyltransferase family protein, partial [Chloroflexota bacterium]|nr:dihydrolipoamide acetyltransferase family protein [Chloroflexota bacterium]
MSTQIVMPQLGESVAEGIIGKWLKQEGDAIAKDEPIVEVVTDKVNAEIPSPVAGVLTKISAPEGATVEVGQEIAVIGDSRDASPAGHGTDSTESTPAPTESPSEAGTAAVASSVPPAASAHANTGSAGAVAPAGTAPFTPRGDGPNGSRRAVRSSPLVQRLAAEHNVDISEIQGTGIGGRVSKKDIMQAIELSAGALPSAGVSMSAAPATQTPAPPSPPAPLAASASPPASAPPTPARRSDPSAPAAPPRPTPAPSAARPAGPDEEYLPVSPVRRMIAEHMVKSKFTLPHATSMIEVDMTPVVQYRDANKAAWTEAQGISLSFMSFVALATVEALRQYPLVNSEWAGDKIILKRNVNLGLAVAAQNGLIVPNIKNADRLSLGGLAHAINDLTARARNGKLTPGDVSGGTFTLNNTGAIGSIWSVSIINYPQAGILSADAIVKRVRVMGDD